MYPGGVELNFFQMLLMAAPVVFFGYLLILFALIGFTLRTIRRWKEGDPSADMLDLIMIVFVGFIVTSLGILNVGWTIIGATAARPGDGGVHSMAQLVNTAWIGVFSLCYITFLTIIRNESLLRRKQTS